MSFLFLLITSFIFSSQIIPKQTSAMFILVTINTEIFPVGTINGIISGVPVFMMDSQKMPVFCLELSPAFGTHKPMQFYRLFSIIA